MVQLRMSEQNVGTVCVSHNDHRKECVWIIQLTALCPYSLTPIVSSQLPEPLPNKAKA